MENTNNILVDEPLNRIVFKKWTYEEYKNYHMFKKDDIKVSIDNEVLKENDVFLIKITFFNKLTLEEAFKEFIDFFYNSNKVVQFQNNTVQEVNKSENEELTYNLTIKDIKPEDLLTEKFTLIYKGKPDKGYELERISLSRKKEFRHFSVESIIHQTRSVECGTEETVYLKLKSQYVRFGLERYAAFFNKSNWFLSYIECTTAHKDEHLLDTVSDLFESLEKFKVKGDYWLDVDLPLRGPEIAKALPNYYNSKDNEKPGKNERREMLFLLNHLVEKLLRQIDVNNSDLWS